MPLFDRYTYIENMESDDPLFEARLNYCLISVAATVELDNVLTQTIPSEVLQKSVHSVYPAQH